MKQKTRVRLVNYIFICSFVYLL